MHTQYSGITKELVIKFNGMKGVRKLMKKPASTEFCKSADADQLGRKKSEFN